MAIVIHPHAFQRMEERGANKEEILKTIKMGRTSPARSGRRRYGMTVSYKDHWQGQFYGHKHIEVLCADEGEDIIVITVVVKYF
ncbi:MAG: DUF4258 domain-containing protein [Candidatus Aminicenantales bacterium]|jgi:hypothetical protein